MSTTVYSVSIIQVRYVFIENLKKKLIIIQIVLSFIKNIVTLLVGIIKKITMLKPSLKIKGMKGK